MAATGVSYSGGVVTINTATGQTKAYYTLTSDAKIFEIDEDGVVTEIAASGITADKTDSVIVLGASDMATTLKAKYVYITKNDATSNAFAVQAYTVGSTGVKTNQGTSVNVVTGTGATTSTVATAQNVTIAAASDAKVGLTITGVDGTTVTVPAEQTLVAADVSYDFVVVVTSESGVTQTCTVTVTFTSVS